MISFLRGTLVEARGTSVVLDVGGVGYELGVSQLTVCALPPIGTQEVALFVRMVVRESAVELFGFGSRDERLVFDKLVGISHVGPKLALAVLSTYAPATLAALVGAQDAAGLARVPGVGKKTASRLLIELTDVFAKDSALKQLASSAQPQVSAGTATSAARPSSAEADALEALLSMGFTSQEAELALEGYEQAGASTVEAMLAFALKRLGGRV